MRATRSYKRKLRVEMLPWQGSGGELPLDLLGEMKSGLLQAEIPFNDSLSSHLQELLISQSFNAWR